MFRSFARRPAALLLGALCVAGPAGCGGPSPAVVHGSVSYDGTPVDNGSILFTPADAGQGQKPAGATVTAGKYTLGPENGPLPGRYKVEILWNKSANNKPLDPDMQSGSQVKQVLPDKFNTATTLTADIKPGDNTADFALTSK